MFSVKRNVHFINYINYYITLNMVFILVKELLIFFAHSKEKYLKSNVYCNTAESTSVLKCTLFFLRIVAKRVHSNYIWSYCDRYYFNLSTFFWIHINDVQFSLTTFPRSKFVFVRKYFVYCEKHDRCFSEYLTYARRHTQKAST